MMLATFNGKLIVYDSGGQINCMSMTQDQVDAAIQADEKWGQLLSFSGIRIDAVKHEDSSVIQYPNDCVLNTEIPNDADIVIVLEPAYIPAQ